MKNYKNRSLGDVIGTVGSMLLFLLFAGGLLMIIATAAGTYSRIGSGFDKTFGATAALRYVSNKIKSADSVNISEDGSVLYLKNGDINDTIYFHDGELYENSTINNNSGSPMPEGGEKLFNLERLNISHSNGLYKITVKIDNEESTAYVRGGRAN